MLSTLQYTAAPTASRTPSPAEATQAAETLFTRQTEAAQRDLQLRIEQISAESTLIAAQAQNTQIAGQQTQIVAATQAAQTAAAYAATQQSIASTQAAEATATSMAIERERANMTGTQMVMQANIASTQSAATSTAVNQMMLDAFSGTATQSAFNANATAESASVIALSTAQAARAKSAEAAAERLAMTNAFMAWLQALSPILAVLGLAAIIYIAGYVWWRANKTRVLYPNQQGAYPVVMQDGRLLISEKAEGGVLDPTKTSDVDPDLRGRIALAATQVGAVRAVAAGNGNSEQTTRRVQNTLGGAAQPTRQQPQVLPFRVVPANRAQNALPSELRDVIEADWREETDGCNH